MLPTNHHELVGIIVLNWNNWRDTIRCMESLKISDYSPCHITVIDNGSLNDSVVQLSGYYKKSGYDTTNTISSIPQIFTHQPSDSRQNYQVQVRFANNELSFLCVSHNSGFAGGMNIGLRFLTEYFSPHLLLLLNNDIILEKSCISHLVQQMRTNSQIGFVGPKIYFMTDENQDSNRLAFTGGVVDFRRGITYSPGINKVDNGIFDQSKKVDFIEGSCMLVNSRLIQDVGVLEPTFFAYYEETDWCVRASKKGWVSCYVPRAKIWHKVGASGGNEINPLKCFYFYRNKLFFMKRNASKSDFFIFINYYYWTSTMTDLLHILLIRKRIKCVIKIIAGVSDGLRLLLFYDSR